LKTIVTEMTEFIKGDCLLMTSSSHQNGNRLAQLLVISWVALPTIIALATVIMINEALIKIAADEKLIRFYHLAIEGGARWTYITIPTYVSLMYCHRLQINVTCVNFSTVSPAVRRSGSCIGDGQEKGSRDLQTLSQPTNQKSADLRECRITTELG
jgi:hypothetical protein